MKAPDLGKMVGPLPLGGWLAAGGAGLVIAWYLRSRGGGSVAAADADASPPAAQPDLSQLGGALQLAGSGSTSSGSDTSTTPRATSNDEWGTLAIRTLLARGYDPLISNSAIGDYLNGNPLDVREQAALALVLQLIGPPPNAVPGLSTTPTPVTTPPPVVAGKPIKRFLRAGGTAGAAAPDVVASVWRHDGKGGYTVNAAKNIRPMAPQGYRSPPMIVWGPGGWAKAAALGRVKSITLDADDRGGTLTDVNGKTARFSIPAPSGAAA